MDLEDPKECSDSWGVGPLRNFKIWGLISGRKNVQIEVPGCPQCTKINENETQNVWNNLVDPLETQHAASRQLLVNPQTELTRS